MRERPPRGFRIGPPGLALALCACAASGLDEPTAVGPDAGAMPTEGVTLRIESAPSTTAWDRAPVQGVGPAEGTLLYQTADGRSFSQSLATSGGFCVDVPLVVGDNAIVFEAVSADGRYSDPVSVTIARSGELPPHGDEPPSSTYHNAVRGVASFDYDLEVFAGQSLSAITDGDASTQAHFGDWSGKTGWLSIPFDARGPLHHVRLQSAQDCPLKNFVLYVSDAPGVPPQRGEAGFDGAWNQIGHFDHPSAASAPSDRTITLDTPISGRHLGIELLGWDLCTPALHPGQHKVREIEAWLELEGEEEPGGDGAPSCQAGF